MATQSFLGPDDIANRALQHLGARRLVSPDTLSAPITRNATTIAQCYDKLRVAELERNCWRFATKRCVLRPITMGTVTFGVTAYSAISTYSLGQLASEAVTQQFWQSLADANTGQALVPGIGAFWERYSGNDYADPWDYTLGTKYFAGEFVVYPNAWASGTTYAKFSIVTYSNGKFYVSLQGTNLNHQPDTSTTFWQEYQTWLGTNPISPPVYGAAGVYMSMISNNLENPVSSPAWVLQSSTPFALRVLWPLGAGPLQDTQTMNILKLPAGFLRECPKDPKAGTPNAWLGAVLGPLEEDYVFDGPFIVTAIVNSTMFRYVADVNSVPKMNSMFCEMLAARIAMECAEELTQSPEKKQFCAKLYQQFAFEARLVNAIIEGAIEPPLDPYVACRF